MAGMPIHAPVLVVPGLWANDWTMRPLAQMLRRRGHPVVPARIGLNIGCTSELVDRLEQRLEASLAHYGRRAAIVGWSRGGTLAKLVTIRRPDLVSALITLGSNNVNPMAVSRMVELQIRLLNRLNAAGVRQVLSSDCVNGECADTMRALLTSPYPSHIPYTSIYSKSDGVVDWRACCDPDAELVEVRASHFQLGVDPRVMRLVAERFDVLERPGQSAAS
jgi:triacylglycerol lipase